MGVLTMLSALFRRSTSSALPASRALQTPLFQISRPWCTAGSSDAVGGTVKWFDSKKGFGFITPKEGGPDVFVHQTAIHAPGFRSLLDGEEVQYKLTLDPNGRYRAEDVTGPDGHYVIGKPSPSTFA